MLLADMGAEVIRIDRAGRGDVSGLEGSRFDVLGRGRRSVAMNLKMPGGAEALLRLVSRADALIEGFRPGVMERMGLGPDVCLARNPRLVYGRMTGWGQDGPMAQAAGHDINYIALSGVLHAIGRRGEAPVPPINLVGDFGGGGMLLAFGVLCAVLEARSSGSGQVVDAAMTEGSALLASALWGYKAGGLWSNDRGTHLIDGGSHFYDSYECSDGKFIAIGAVEPQFYSLLRERIGLNDSAFDAHHDPVQWPRQKSLMAEVFRQRTRAEWCDLLEGTDACFSPVLNWDEAPLHSHNQARNSFVEIEGVVQPAPAPRFSRSSPTVPTPTHAAGSDTVQVLQDWGMGAHDIGQLQRDGVI
jgi:alpha-methylacyl-CoA racemase